MTSSEMRSLVGRRVLVSGGTTGIGRGIVEHLDAAGAVVFAFSHDESSVIEARRALPRVLFDHGDVADPSHVRRIAGRCRDELGGLDALVNNAGTVGMSVSNLTFDEWERVIRINLSGAMHLAQECLPLLIDAGGGHIVNIGSMSAKTRDGGMDVYVATKSGLQGWSDSFGRTVAKENVAVSLIEPGLTQTELSRQSEELDRQKLEEARKMMPADVARVVCFILSQPLNICLPLVQVRPRMQLI